MNSASGLLCLSGDEEQKDVDARAGWRTILHAPSATFMRGVANGGMEVNSPLVKEVFVADNARMTKCGMAICEGGRMRSVWFEGGGEFHARFGWDDCLIELCGAAIRVKVSENRLTIEPFVSAAT
jgi:hypothetical protein